MAKQVIWSLVAKKQLKETFQILKLKNGNNEVSEVLDVYKRQAFRVLQFNDTYRIINRPMRNRKK